MKTKKSKSFYILIAVIFSLIYIIFAIKPLNKEYQFVPEWKIDVVNPTIKEADDGQEKIFYKLGQSLGYFTDDGKITNFVSFPFKGSISENYYTTYTASNSSCKFFDPDGKEQGTIKVTGFPLIDQDRIFVFQPGGSSFSMCDEKGNKKWEYSGTIPITAFDSSKSAVSAGFADGTICVLDLNGHITQHFIPGGSDYPVILGTGISSDGEMIGVVCGQNKQRFVLAQKNGSQSKIIFHEFLKTDTPHQKLVKFSNDDTAVIYAAGNQLGIINTKTKKSSHISIKGQAIKIEECGNTFFILTKKQKNYTVYAVEKFATLVGSFSFTADNAFIQAHNDSLYVGKDYTISKIKIVKN